MSERDYTIWRWKYLAKRMFRRNRGYGVKVGANTVDIDYGACRLAETEEARYKGWEE